MAVNCETEVTKKLIDKITFDKVQAVLKNKSKPRSCIKIGLTHNCLNAGVDAIAPLSLRLSISITKELTATLSICTPAQVNDVGNVTSQE